jgi:hypothetical protein
MRWCLNCNQNVDPKGSINGIIVVLLFLFCLPGMVAYLIYALTQPKTCPICNGTRFGSTAP